MHGGQFIASVALVKALGGGWEGLPVSQPSQEKPSSATVEKN
jgi:hypothetical protein